MKPRAAEIRIINSLGVRPMTVDQLAEFTATPYHTIYSALRRLLEQGRVKPDGYERQEGRRAKFRYALT